MAKQPRVHRLGKHLGDAERAEQAAARKLEAELLRAAVDEIMEIIRELAKKLGMYAPLARRSFTTTYLSPGKATSRI